MQPSEVLAFLVADHVHRDPSTGKFFLLGTRSSIVAVAFPFTSSSLSVYASLIDGRDETPILLRVVDVDEAREAVLEFETPVNFLDPTEEVELAFVLNDLIFPEPGDYRFQLYAGGQFLRERRLIVIPSENPGNH